jgi:hypothetical protein
VPLGLLAVIQVEISASHIHIPAWLLTLNLVIPKMALDSELHTEAAILANPTNAAPRNLYRAIATDIHFWIPLSVLLGGVFLLDKLR